MNATVTPMLTAVQSHILRYVREHQINLRYPPTLRQIRMVTGCRDPLAELRELEARGWIARHPRIPRALIVRNPVDGTDT